MSDLVQRARAEAKVLAASGVNGAGNMINDLADEIERLREELNVTRLQRDAKLSSQTAVDEAAAREIERLRDALEKIEFHLGMPAKWYRNLAREALKGETHED